MADMRGEQLMNERDYFHNLALRTNNEFHWSSYKLLQGAVSKVLERLIHKQLATYFDELNLLCKSQSRFRRMHSTEMAVTYFASRLAALTRLDLIGSCKCSVAGASCERGKGKCPNCLFGYAHRYKEPKSTNCGFYLGGTFIPKNSKKPKMDIPLSTSVIVGLWSIYSCKTSNHGDRCLVIKDCRFDSPSTICLHHLCKQ
ncbi:unnamed protein product, partial [Porites evermanni]